MEAEIDYKKLLALFNANEVRHLIIGAYRLPFMEHRDIPAIWTFSYSRSGRTVFVSARA